MVSTTARREAVGWLRETRGFRLRRACRLIGLSTATWRYQRRLSAANTKLLEQLHTHAAARSRFGYRRLHVLIARDGTIVNHKRLYRLYRAAGLQVRRRRRKRLTRGERVPLPAPTRRGERWSMDFTLDTLADGRAFRTLNIVDDYHTGVRGDRGRPIAAWSSRDARPRSTPRRNRFAAIDRPGQRARVCRPHAGSVGVRGTGHALLHSTGQTDRERVRRRLQWQISRRVFE